jgi:hypothetical protein
MNSTEDDKYSKLVDFTALNGYYTIPILGLIGFCTNIACILVIFSPKFKDRKKYNYVITKITIELFACVYFIGFQVKYLFRENKYN